MQNALVYCRVSSDEQVQKGYSLDAQEKYCIEFSKRNNFKVLGVFRDEGKSGTTLNRPALQDVLALCQKNNSINALIIQETDRLARNTKDHLTIKALLKKAEVKIISVAQPMLDDSPEGLMVDTILASINQFQSDINSRKTKKGMQEKFNQGWYPGWAPLGYINATIETGNERSRNIIKNDLKKWYILKEGFKLYLTDNFSIYAINEILYEQGLRSKNDKKVPHSVMTSILKNPFYAGIMRWNKQNKIGKHESMITIAEHEQVLAIMDSHNLHACRKRKHSFLLRGFVFCNICNRRYTAEKHPRKKKEYYHCSTRDRHNNKGQNIEKNKIEKEIEDQFNSVVLDKEFIDIMTAQLKNIYSSQKEDIVIHKQVLQNQKNAIENKRDKAEEKLLNGIISDDDFVRIKEKFKTELHSIQKALFEFDNQTEFDTCVIQEFLSITKDIYNSYKNAPYELKRQYLGLFWDKFLMQDRKIIKAIPSLTMRTLIHDKEVIIEPNLLPSSLSIISLLNNRKHMATLREKCSLIKSIKKN